MHLCVVAIGQRMPSWVVSGWEEYARRFPRGYALRLQEVPAIRRGPNADIEAIRRRESEALIAATPPASLLVALDEKGKQWTTLELSAEMRVWMQDGRDIAFLIGGPDGISEDCLGKAQHRWSLGRLTLPHALVRVVLAEQLYRAWAVTQNHPYHRE